MRLIAVGALLSLVLCGTASAHHGSAISYDLSKQVTLTGVVTEWVWKNPHCFVMFDVTEQGKSVTWGAETHPTTFLVRNEVNGVPVPLSATSIKPGDQVTVTLFPSRVGAPRGLLAKLVNAEGKVLLDDGDTRNRRPPTQ
jgi:Family of unknown function (DUF6152)